ncbi:MAG: anthranilate synthase [Candidatus Tokpelaia sp. JSC161]|nr:MAG: anthranilate synthase [Candidatus Tokpelaia sp. JSC161]
MVTDNTRDKTQTTYKSDRGILISRQRELIAYEGALNRIMKKLDSQHGAIFSSNYEYPGRYTRWDIGIFNPPLMISSRQRSLTAEALNQRGTILLKAITREIEKLKSIKISSHLSNQLIISIINSPDFFSEEERSRIPSIFTVLRAIVKLFSSNEDNNLGLYGAFGYDLAFQFEPIRFRMKRPKNQRDLVLYLPDSILIVDHYANQAWIDRYDFTITGQTTKKLPRETASFPYKKTKIITPFSDFPQGNYAALVRQAKETFKRGDLFEVVPSQTFYQTCTRNPSSISRQLKKTNPSPYSFFINLGNQEYLIGASPEMFVRVSGKRVETCPISGTIKRGEDAIDDSQQILKLLNSKKDESELTMCSDVDRNDKSRVCTPGSVRVIGRRQIEIYSRLIHTVDHIEGYLREGMDGFDAFLSHAWAVTVTGAPKLWAMRFIEDHEKSPRSWYGGAIGRVSFNGDLNTGLTLRTIHIKNGIASIRVGATLLFDSIPEEEEKETQLKASALIAALKAKTKTKKDILTKPFQIEKNICVLLVDHEDSFVHTLANYFRQTGAKITTVRTPVSNKIFSQVKPNLIVLSPGPGLPKDFNCAATISKARQRNIYIFGVCLGMQAIVEAYGGKLQELKLPMHGKSSNIHITAPSAIFTGLPKKIQVGRYHSVYADQSNFPDDLLITAKSDDGIIMGIEHKREPVTAVQFHPESIMTLHENIGMRIIENIVEDARKKQSF